MNQKTILLTLTKKRKFTLKVEGTSMLPILRPDDVLSLEKTTFAQIRENDVALIIKGKQPMIHRVIYKTKNYLVTRGDHRMVSDGRIKPTQVYAKVVGVKRGTLQFRLEDYYLIQSSRYFKEIAALCNTFVTHNIDFVILKGLPLHLYFEGAHPRRIFADFDVLVAPSHYSQAHRILTKLRYESVDTAYSSTHKKLKNKLTSLSYHKHTADFPIVVDLHMEPVFLFNQLGRLNALYPQNLLDQMTHDFLRDKQWITLENHRFPILDPAHLFVYLCLHFFHHNFRGMYRLNLIDIVWRKFHNQKNFTKSVSNAIASYRVGNFLFPVFSMLKSYLQTPIPIQMLSLKPSYNLVQHYTQKRLINIPIFDDQDRLRSGINRFLNLLILSPQSIPKKLTLIFDPAVWYSIVWSMRKLL